MTFVTDRRMEQIVRVALHATRIYSYRTAYSRHVHASISWPARAVTPWLVSKAGGKGEEQIKRSAAELVSEEHRHPFEERKYGGRPFAAKAGSMRRLGGGERQFVGVSVCTLPWVP